MSLTEKTNAMPDAATLALWRAAENGDLRELEAAVRRVADIDACNEHGVTALMRAAQQGHVRVVRVLLEHSADTNIKRNDKFTALALAAFFGHTAVVRELMENGADSRASTRSGTSPQMWATARTFNEVVNQLEKPAPATPVRKPVNGPAKVPNAVKMPEPVRQSAAVPVVVRTLKEPPEIWDLVHEVPRGFNARSAFAARLKSTGLVFRMAAGVVLIAVSVVGVMMLLRGVQARSEKDSEFSSRAPVATTNAANEAPKTEVRAESAAVDAAPITRATDDTENAVTTQKTGSRTRVVSSHRVERVQTRRAAAAEVVQPIVTPTEKAESEPRPAPQTRVKANTPLSPQLIAPSKSATPKPKVIQWP